MQATGGRQGRQVACVEAHASILLGAFNCLTSPPPVWVGAVTDYQLVTLLLLLPAPRESGWTPVSVSKADQF